MMQTPRYVAIETINTCNARCPFCPLFQGEAMMSREHRPAQIMKDELFDSIVSEIASWPEPPGWRPRSSPVCCCFVRQT